jgi:hypothetical protein
MCPPCTQHYLALENFEMRKFRRPKNTPFSLRVSRAALQARPGPAVFMEGLPGSGPSQGPEPPVAQRPNEPGGTRYWAREHAVTLGGSGRRALHRLPGGGCHGHCATAIQVGDRHRECNPKKSASGTLRYIWNREPRYSRLRNRVEFTYRFGLAGGTVTGSYRYVPSTDRYRKCKLVETGTYQYILSTYQTNVMYVGHQRDCNRGTRPTVTRARTPAK